MNYKITPRSTRDPLTYKTAAKRMGLKQPVDGYTPEEVRLEKLVSDLTVGALYAKLPTARMKFIVATHFELGYPQEMVADMLSIKQSSLVDEITLIRRILLGKPYSPRKQKVTVKQEDLFRVLMMLQHQ